MLKLITLILLVAIVGGSAGLLIATADKAPPTVQTFLWGVMLTGTIVFFWAADPKNERYL